MKKQPILVLSFAVFILIISAGYFYYRYETKIIRQEQYSDLKTIADLKVNQILEWREERLADAKVISEGSFIRQNFQRWLISQDSTLEKNLLERFSLLRYNHKYENVFVVSAGGKLLLDLNGTLKYINSETIDYCNKALQDKNAFLSDFYFSPAHDTIHLDVFAPILNDKNVEVAVLVLRVNPYDFLYPLIQSWPTSSKSAETLIIRRDGDSILYENELRHISNTALRLRIPLTRIEVPAVQAVMGNVGIYEGLDYRGVSVLAEIRPVPGTPWFMVAKVDQSEIFSELRYRTVIVIIITLLLLMFFGIGISWLYNIRQRNIYRKLLESGTALNESQEEFRTTLYSIGDAVITTDVNGCIRNMNVVAEKLTGWKESVGVGRSIPEVFHIVNEESHDKVESPVQRVLKEGLVVGLANHTLLISKDGKEIPIADSGAPIRNERGDITGVVLVFRDQTQERAAQRTLRESEEKFRIIFEHTTVGKSLTLPDGKLSEVNKAFAEMLGGTVEEMHHINFTDITHPNDIPESRECVRSLLANERSTYRMEKRYKHKNGTYIWTDVSTTLLRDNHGDPINFITSISDISERKQAEEQLRKLNRIYSLLSDINQAIVRTRVTEELFNQVCEIAVNQGGFGMAWIGLVDETSQKLRVIAQAGRTNGYNEQVNISLKGKPLSYCPVDSALRHGKHYICKIIENKEMAPCQKIAYDLGFRSSASFPLRVSDILKGALTFYSEEPDFFDDAELKLLDELSMDISFAMEYAEKEAGRKLVEESLKTSEVRFRIAAETSNDMVYEWDLKQEVIWFGKIDEMLGYAPGEFPRTLEGLGASVHPEDWVRVMAAVQAHLDGRAPYAEDYRVLMKNGTFRWWSARGAVARMPDGKPFRWIGTVTDITERKQAEKTLQDSEARYKTLVENIPQKIFMKDKDFRWMSINENFARDLGISPEEIIGKLDTDLFSEELAEKYHADDVRIITTGKTEELEEKYLVDGKETWVNTIKTPVRGDKGEIVGMLGIFWDITRRKLEEETLRIKNQVFEDSIASQSIADNAGMITHVNPAFLSLWGYTSNEQAIGKSVGSFFADQADAVPVLEALAARDAWEGEFRAKRTDGKTFISRGFATSLRNSRGDLVGYQSTNLDVTKEREAEKEIIKLNAELEDRVVKRTTQLEASNKELEAFSYSVSHDLRAPLRHVSGYVELLNKHFQVALPEKGRHYLDSIADSVHVMGMLIDDLLQFSRTGRMEMHQSDFDMNEIVKEVRESLSKDNPDRKIEWLVGKLPLVNGDEAMLRVVWTNLLSNAVKFTRTRKKARIEIGVRNENKELVFFVRDNGVGFDMQYAQKLFGVFQRLHPTEDFEGTGIGLANVHRIVLRQGGRTWAESEPDKGAVFYFSIQNK